jgi:hypothetical protein
MSTAVENVVTPVTYRVEWRSFGYVVVDSNGVVLTNTRGDARVFVTRNSARKAVTRLNRPAGDRHR